MSDACGKLPTLGYMNASGSLLIQAGYYPKIASGFTLSDAWRTIRSKIFPLFSGRETADGLQGQYTNTITSEGYTKNRQASYVLKVNSFKKSGK